MDKEEQAQSKSNRALRIDLHTHILPHDIPDFAQKFGYGGFVQLAHDGPCKARMLLDGKFFREVEQNCYDSCARISDCDRDNVDVQVLSTVPVMFSYWAKPQHALEIAQFLNDNIAKTVAENPTRFIGLGTLPMQAPELAVEELRRCVEVLGFAGVQIGSHVNDMNLNREEFFPIYAEAERLGAAIFVHPWDMMGQERMSKYWLPWLVGMPAETSMAICSMIFGGIFEKFPKLKVAFAHGGGSFPGTVGRIEHGFNCRPDLCAIDCKTNPRAFCGRFWVDSLVHDADSLQCIVKLFGADKVCLGTDYPFPLGEHKPGDLIDSMAFDKEVKEKLLGLNCLDLLGIPHDKFK